MNIPLSIIIPVKNDDRNLAEWLSLLEDFDDVQIVDSGSLDHTNEVAVNWERPIVQFKWNGQFPKKRNWALRTLTLKYPWVMFLDADERMTPMFKAEISKFLKSEEAEKYDIIRCFYDNWFMGRMLRHGDIMQKTSILRVGSAEYECIEENHWSNLDMEIHEHIIPRRLEAEYTITAWLEHHDKRPLESYCQKHEEYAKWEANRYYRLIEKYGRIDNIPNLTKRQKTKYKNITKKWFATAYLLVSYVFKGGFMDGRAGLVFALGKMRYFRRIRQLIFIKSR